MNPAPILPSTMAARGEDVERALMSALILDPTRLPLTAGLLMRDFADKDLGILFGLVQDMDAAGLPWWDPVALTQQTARRSDLTPEARHPFWLAKLIGHEGKAAHAAYYAGVIRDRARRREIARLVEELGRRLDDPSQETDQIREYAEQRLQRLVTTSDATEAVGTIAERMVADLRRSADRSESRQVVWPGLPILNARIGAFLGGELIVLAARPGAGKTALAMQIAFAAAQEQGRPVLFVSLEMRQTELVMRLLAGEAGINSREFRGVQPAASSIDAIDEVAQQIRDTPLLVYAPRGVDVTIGRIRAAARLTAATTGLSLIVVDYLQLVAPEDRRVPRHEQVAEMSRRLKQLSQEMDCPVLCLAQLNREAEQASKPLLSHLRESGAIEQDADCVLMIHKTADREVSLCVPKHRHGEAGDIPLAWIPERTRFAGVDSAGASPVAELASWSGNF